MIDYDRLANLCRDRENLTGELKGLEERRATADRQVTKLTEEIGHAKKKIETLEKRIDAEVGKG